MVIIVHEDAKCINKVLRGDQEIIFESATVVDEYWKLAENFSEDLILWVEKKFFISLNTTNLKGIFFNDLVMASYAIENQFLSNSIGYVDKLPFINVNQKVQYPTWRMSTDVGGIKGKVLLRFKEDFGKIKDFGYLLNSIAKSGQQNGLLCYSSPWLVDIDSIDSPGYTATSAQLFSFVYQFYKTIWTGVLLWCLWKYEKKNKLGVALLAFFEQKKFLKEVDLFGLLSSTDDCPHGSFDSIDVVIPTLGRPQFLMQVIKDLSQQSLLPKNVMVVEQNPDPQSVSQLIELQKHEWPFKIVHHFIHRTGACNSRNLALKDVSSDWVFFADDDIRLKPDLLQKSLEELKRLGVDCININCRQEGEDTVFKKIKQWGSFGSGTSIVKSAFCKETKYDEVYEHGYGEDKDYGMQLRNQGCDIIYHPGLEILHLKAPIGGFRQKTTPEWQQEELLPKPSPSLMVYAQKYYSPEQFKGFKTELYLRYYWRQQIKNPLKYLQVMGKRWKKSEEWADLLKKRSEIPAKIKLEE